MKIKIDDGEKPFKTSTGYIVLCDIGEDDRAVNTAVDHSIKQFEMVYGRKPKISDNEMAELKEEAIRGIEEIAKTAFCGKVKFEHELTDAERKEYERWWNNI